MTQKRIYAFLIDLLMMTVPAVMLIDLEVFVWKHHMLEAGCRASGVLAGLLLMKDTVGGRSLGKYFMGLRVFNRSGKKINLLLRNIGLVVLPVEVVFYFSYGKRLGDVWFKTEVLAAESTTMKKSTELMASVFGTLLVLYISATNLIGLYIRQKEEYLVMEAFVHGNEALKEKTGEVVRMGRIPRYNINKRKDQTDVRIETKIYGKKDNADLIVFLQKKAGGKWVVIDYKYAGN